MNEIDYFKNFNLGKEIDLAGSFAYNALSILNTEDNIYQNDQIFLFLYNTAVSVERLQKCVLFICGNYDETNIFEFAKSLKSHKGCKKSSIKIANRNLTKKVGKRFVL